ncbi:T-cell-specific guanine nucleotide triphosphate-binding protein 2-like [Branchiostoma floridae x Branchiostoma belcheri]
MAEFLGTVETTTDQLKEMALSYATAEGEAKSQLLKDIQQYAVKKVDEWKSQAVYIGIIGDPGAGKSTFINSFRGLKPKEKGAAATGLKHTTTVVTEYPHPKRPENLILIDFPGVLLKKGEGSEKAFDIKQYLDVNGPKMKLCDVFLVFSSCRIQHNAVQIGMEARKMRKKILFVRSKFDDDVRDQKKNDPDYLIKNTEEHLRESLREDYIEVLKDVGWEEAVKPEDVFIISGELDPVTEGLYDMSKLRKAMIDDLDGLKKMVVINTCRDYSKAMVEEKARVYRDQVWKIALAVTAVSIVPVLGTVSIPVAWSEAYKQYKEGFGLDGESLEHLAKMTRKNLDDLKGFVQSRIVQGERKPGQEEIEAAFDFAVTGGMMAAMAVDQMADYMLPILGAIITAPLSYGITDKVLNKVITIQEECARDLFDYAFRETAV